MWTTGARLGRDLVWRPSDVGVEMPSGVRGNDVTTESDSEMEVIYISPWMTEKQRQEEQDLCTYGLFGELECDLTKNMETSEINGDCGVISNHVSVNHATEDCVKDVMRCSAVRKLIEFYERADVFGKKRQLEVTDPDNLTSLDSGCGSDNACVESCTGEWQSTGGGTRQVDDCQWSDSHDSGVDNSDLVGNQHGRHGNKYIGELSGSDNGCDSGNSCDCSFNDDGHNRVEDTCKADARRLDDGCGARELCTSEEDDQRLNGGRSVRSTCTGEADDDGRGFCGIDSKMDEQQLDGLCGCKAGLESEGESEYEDDEQYLQLEETIIQQEEIIEVLGRELKKFEDGEKQFKERVEVWEKQASREKDALVELRERYEKEWLEWEEEKSQIKTKKLQHEHESEMLKEKESTLSTREVKYQQRVVKLKEERKACEEYLKAKQKALLDAEAKLKEERAQFERLEGCYDPAHVVMEARQRVPPRRERRPLRFDATGPWKDFHLHFEACKLCNMWTDEEAALQLFTCCQGEALSVLSVHDLDPRSVTYRELVELMSKVFGPGECSESYFGELMRREQRPGESLHRLGQDIRRLVTLAYPKMDKVERDKIATEHFKQAVGSPELRKEIFMAGPKTFEDTVRYAQMVESFQRTEAFRLQRCKMSSREAVNGDLVSVDPSECEEAPFVDEKQSRNIHRTELVQQAQERTVESYVTTQQPPLVETVNKKCCMPEPTDELLKQCGTEVYTAFPQTECNVPNCGEQMAVYSECQNSGKSTVDCRRSEHVEERDEWRERCMEDVLACSVRLLNVRQDGIEENILCRDDAGQLSDAKSTGFEPHVELELNVSESLEGGRKSQKSGTEKPSNELSSKKNTQGEKLEITFEKIREEQLVDQTIAAILKWKESGNEKPLKTEVLKLPPGVHVYWQQWKLLSVKEGVLVRKWESGDGKRIKWLIVLPEKMREQVMQEMCVSYQDGQDSVVRNVTVLRNKYYWVEMADDVQTYLYGVPNVRRRCNGQVGGRTYKSGQFVLLRSVEKSMKPGALGFSWKGPYQVVEVLSDNMLRIQILQGARPQVVCASRLCMYVGVKPKTWNYVRPMVLKEEGPTLHVVDVSKVTVVDRRWSRREERTSNSTVESGSPLSEGAQRGSNVERRAQDRRRSPSGAWGNRSRRECRDMQWRKTDHLEERKVGSLKSGTPDRRNVTTAPVEVLRKELCSGQSRASRGGGMKEHRGVALRFN